jgi:hypothetical protein
MAHRYIVFQNCVSCVFICVGIIFVFIMTVIPNNLMIRSIMYAESVVRTHVSGMVLFVICKGQCLKCCHANRHLWICTAMAAKSTSQRLSLAKGTWTMVPLYGVTKYLCKKCLYHRKVVVDYWKNTAGMLQIRSVRLCVHTCVCANLPKEFWGVFLGGSTVGCILLPFDV